MEILGTLLGDNLCEAVHSGRWWKDTSCV